MSLRLSIGRTTILALALLGLVAVLPQTSGDPGNLHCLRFPDNDEVYRPGYGTVCAGWGSGCMDCWTECEGGQPCGEGECHPIVGCEEQQPV